MSMNEFFQVLDTADDRGFGLKGFAAFDQLLNLFPDGRADALIVLHRESKDELLQLFERDRALSQHLQDFVFMYLNVVNDEKDILEPIFLQGIGSVLGTVAREYVGGYTESKRDPVRKLVLALIDSVAADYSERVEPQTRTIWTLIERVLYEPAVVEHKGRILLIEMPLGNSVPTKLLHYFMHKHGFQVETLRIALARNERAIQGMTRKELLGKQLTDISKEDLLIYCDEWFSGANFKSLVEHIDGLTKRASAKLLPIGMLAVASDRYIANASAIRKHKRIVQQNGFGSERSSRFRIDFPPVLSKFEFPGYFFWGEHDRTSGYRKMQVLGAYLSSVKATLEMLASDQQLLKEANVFMIMDAAKHGIEIPHNILDHFDSFYLKFHAGLREFRQQEPELGAIEDTTNEGVCDEDFGVANARVMGKFREVLGDEARFSVEIAILFNLRRGATEPADRYYLQTHAPIIRNLEDDRRQFHEALMGQLISKIENASFSE